nr:autotransporter outer membrane beta-barrel domain-containing protein [Bradyrhizobium sp. NAS80.1]
MTKALPRPEPKQWLAWADVRGSNWSTSVQTGDIRGGQVNALLGVTRKITADLLVGMFGGYETFDYTSELLAGRLKGDGWTVGGYLGWRIAQSVRFDAGVARAGISYDGVAGTAAATFPGQRWIATAALVGTYKTAQGFEIEPSARVYAIWEHDDAYTDNLGITQTERTFSNGRASAGTKVAYPWMCSPTVTLTPYVGVYADYYFNSDDATVPLTPLLLPTQFVQGWSARVTGGLGVTTTGGARVSIGGEMGGLGSDQFTMWSVRGRASLPF